MSTEPSNFIRAIIDADRAAGKHQGRVATRFPPEPNGYLHIGHAKAICLNFGLAADYAGTCNLRFDDTNPVAEDTEFVDAILDDVAWLGFQPDAVLFASDYFDQLYAWAEELVRAGLAYVDDQTIDEIRAARGTVTEPGTPSPYRDRTADENLDLLRRMKAGEFEDGARVLRARIDLGHPNMKMRDPLMYRIRHAHHHRTGDAWCIYPMYDWAHGQSDAIEGITHSICTLEFDVNRELYDWFTQAIGFQEPPHQYEMARLNLSYTVMSKRFLKRLVTDGIVDGWDDPRMPTIAGMRRRGIPASAIRALAERVGVARANSTVDLDLFEHLIRDDLNHKARRRMGVLDPLKVVLTNWRDAHTEFLVAPDFPLDVGLPGDRRVPFSRELYIERGDFAVDPPKGFKRLVPGGAVRLRYGYVIRCDEVITDPGTGDVVELRCTVDEDSMGPGKGSMKAKGVIHWVCAAHALPATVRWVDRLFTVPTPGAVSGDYMDDLNPDAMQVQDALLEHAVGDDEPGVHYQLERHGYVYRAPEDAGEGLVFNGVVSLKETWGAEETEPTAPVKEVRIDPTANAEAQAELRAAQRRAHFQAHPDVAARFRDLVGHGVSDDDAWTVVSDDLLTELHRQAADVADAGAVARWIANVLASEVRGQDGPLPFDGAALGRLVALVEDGTLSAALGKKVQAELLAHGGDPKAIAADKGWVQVSDEAELEALVGRVLAGLPDEVARYRDGDRKLVGFFMGQVMRASQGKANPGVVKPILERLLG